MLLSTLLACDCHPVGTALGNGTMCDQVTGQCVCNTTARIGGMLCDRCMENSWNTSASLFSCTGKCDASSISRFHILSCLSNCITFRASCILVPNKIYNVLSYYQLVNIGKLNFYHRSEVGKG